MQSENLKMYLAIGLVIILLVGVFLHAAIYKPSAAQGEEKESEEHLEEEATAVEPEADAPDTRGAA